MAGNLITSNNDISPATQPESRMIRSLNISQLAEILGPQAAQKLHAATSKDSNGASGSSVAFQIDVRLCSESDDRQAKVPEQPPLSLGRYRLCESTQVLTPPSSSSASPWPEDYADDRESHVPVPRPSTKRHKQVGGLRLGGLSPSEPSVPLPRLPSPSPSEPAETPRTRQIVSATKEFPQRKPKATDGKKPEPLSSEKFISGVWSQLYGSVKIEPLTSQDLHYQGIMTPTHTTSQLDFKSINILCGKATALGRSSRAYEIIVQAYWVDSFEDRIATVKQDSPQLSATEAKMSVFREACSILQWSDKELRNKLFIWRGYKEIKDAAGWVALIFAGAGIYRFCKYRSQALTLSLTGRLNRIRHGFEVAADTLHPRWRELLKVIGLDDRPKWTGHPQDWVIQDGDVPCDLKQTYSQWDPDFEFEHIQQSRIDASVWESDPRRVASSKDDKYTCGTCGLSQSETAATNECQCFTELYGVASSPSAVQVFRTAGKNNGLIARCAFGRGAAIGEFVGVVTKGTSNLDVMQGGRRANQYQILQKRMGNYTRFVNHSCAPNSQFQKFIWLGIERIILVSRGIPAGTEITVDYSHQYWTDLDKRCLCGEPCCRYSKKRKSGEVPT